jgi:hypothetical protein
LSEYLKGRGVDVRWIEARVVWAKREKLWLKQPAVRVWQVKNSDYLVKDIEKSRPVHEDVVLGTIAVLKDLQKRRKR